MPAFSPLRACYLFLWLFPLVVSAQRSSVVSRDSVRPNNINIGISYGEIIEKRNAYFYGIAVEYSRKLNNLPAGLGVGIMWDSETDRAQTRPVETFTGALTGSYLLSERFSLATGLAKGFVDDDNPGKTYKFTDGDWSTGIIVAYIIPTGKTSFIGLTTSLEYNLSKGEPSISLDLSYALNW